MTTRSLRCSCEQTHCTGTTAMWAGCDTKPGRGPYPVCGDSRGAVGSREYALFACSRPAESIPAATAAQAPPQSAHRGGEPTISARLFDSLKKRNFLKNRSDSELSAEEEARKRCEGRGHEHGQHVVLHAASVDVAPAPHFAPACKHTCAHGRDSRDLKTQGPPFLQISRNTHATQQTRQLTTRVRPAGQRDGRRRPRELQLGGQHACASRCTCSGSGLMDPERAQPADQMSPGSTGTKCWRNGALLQRFWRLASTGAYVGLHALLRWSSLCFHSG